MNPTKLIAILAGVAIVVIGGGVALQRYSSQPSSYDGFAQCLKDKGAIFYGAFWCPHCQAQKKLFGTAEKYLPYKECSLPSGQGQTQECTEKNIKSYPTWRFTDGSEETGEVSLERLAEKTGCQLPAAQ